MFKQYLVIFLLVAPAPVLACTVSPLPIQQRIAEADAIFTGQVLKEHKMKKASDSLDHFSEILVKRRFKGKIPKKIKVYYLKVNRKDGYGGSCDSREVGFGAYYAGRKDELTFFVIKEGDKFVTRGDLSAWPSASGPGLLDIKAISEKFKVDEGETI